MNQQKSTYRNHVPWNRLLLLVGLMIMVQVPLYGSTNLDDIQKPYMVKEFSLDGAGNLKTYTPSGNIEVQKVSNTNNVRVELYVERGYAIWSDSRNLDNYRINILQRGNEIIASVEGKKRSTSLFGDKVNFNFKIYVPERMSTELKTSAGNIRLSGVTGDQMAKSSGGNIVLNGLRGKIGAYTTGGNIDIRGSKGTIFAQTEGGDITVGQSEGELRLRTSGGNISSQQITGSFIARADGGNVKGQFLDVGQGISIQTSAGNIYAELPGSVGMNLTASGSQIDFVDVDEFYGKKNQRTVEGRLNDGGVPVQLQTSSGNITIKTY